MPNESLKRCIQEEVFAGRLDPAVASDLHDLIESKIHVDDSNEVCFIAGGALLEDGLREYISKRNYLLPPQTNTSELDRRAALEREALSGSVSAHGKLFRELGSEKYEQWKIEHRAAPGKDATTADGSNDAAAIDLAINKLTELKQSSTRRPTNGSGDHANNPFSKVGWSISKQGALVKSLGLAKASEIAASVGVTVGSTKPVI